MYYIYGQSGPSLLIESTDSMMIEKKRGISRARAASENYADSAHLSFHVDVVHHPYPASILARHRDDAMGGTSSKASCSSSSLPPLPPLTAGESR